MGGGCSVNVLPASCRKIKYRLNPPPDRCALAPVLFPTACIQINFNQKLVLWARCPQHVNSMSAITVTFLIEQQ
jgi:hypothetical protein